MSFTYQDCQKGTYFYANVYSLLISDNCNVYQSCMSVYVKLLTGCFCQIVLSRRCLVCQYCVGSLLGLVSESYHDH